MQRIEKKALIFFLGKDALTLSPKQLAQALYAVGVPVNETMTLREILTIVVAQFKRDVKT